MSLIPKAKYLWIDLETTGLSPTNDCILECAAVVTDSKLENLYKYQIVLQGDDAALKNMNDFVRDMHTKNGLLEAVDVTPYNFFDLQKDLVNLIQGFSWDMGKPILAGATVHFDRSFLAEWCPSAEGLFHHRHLDTSSLKLAVCDVRGTKFESGRGGVVEHRAMDDILVSIEQTKQVYEYLKV